MHDTKVPRHSARQQPQLPQLPLCQSLVNYRDYRELFSLPISYCDPILLQSILLVSHLGLNTHLYHSVLPSGTPYLRGGSGVTAQRLRNVEDQEGRSQILYKKSKWSIAGRKGQNNGTGE